MTGTAAARASAMRAAFLAVLAAVLLASAAARLAAVRTPTLAHPDEVIATGVVQHVRAQPTLDTNWKHARLPAPFDGPQYNFSGYLLPLAAYDAGADAVAGRPADEAGRLRRLRYFSVLFSVAAIALTGAIALALSPGSYVAATAAVVLAALMPSHLMESFYARPDAFTTFLALAALLVVLVREAIGPRWIAVAAALVGYLVATKVSFGVMYLLLLPGLRSARAAVIGHVALAVGFALGAPGAVGNPGDFIAGVSALSQQYGGDFPPNGLGSAATTPERLIHAGTWIAQTWGPAVVLAIVGAWHLAASGRGTVLVPFLPFLILLVYFSALPVFFERNVTPALMAMAPLAGVGIASAIASRRGRWLAPTLAAGLAVAAIAIPWRADAKILSAVRAPRESAVERRSVESKVGVPATVLGWARPALPRSAPGPRLIEVYHAYDLASRRWLDGLRAEGWVDAARSESRFAKFVPSTFHTYLSEGVVWLSRDSGP
jgi:hypothetical protein